MEIRKATPIGHSVPRFSRKTDGNDKPIYANPKILDPLFALVMTPGRMDSDAKGALAKLWTNDTKGAITTFGRVIREMAEQLTRRHTARMPDGSTMLPLPVADHVTRLRDFLGFLVREDYWHQKTTPEDQAAQISQFMQEFGSVVGKRSEASRQNAVAKGLDPRHGAWRGFIGFLHDHLRETFREAIRTVKAQHPPGSDPIPPGPVRPKTN